MQGKLLGKSKIQIFFVKVCEYCIYNIYSYVYYYILYTSIVTIILSSFFLSFAANHSHGLATATQAPHSTTSMLLFCSDDMISSSQHVVLLVIYSLYCILTVADSFLDELSVFNLILVIIKYFFNRSHHDLPPSSPSPPSPLCPLPSALSPLPSPYPSSLIPCPSSLVPRRSSLVPCPLSLVPCPLSLVPCPLFSEGERRTSIPLSLWKAKLQ